MASKLKEGREWATRSQSIAHLAEGMSAGVDVTAMANGYALLFNDSAVTLLQEAKALLQGVTARKREEAARLLADVQRADAAAKAEQEAKAKQDADAKRKTA